MFGFSSDRIYVRYAIESGPVFRVTSLAHPHLGLFKVLVQMVKTTLSLPKQHKTE